MFNSLKFVCYGFKTYFIYKCYSKNVSLFYSHLKFYSFNNAFYFQECTIITPSPLSQMEQSRLLHLVNSYLVSSINQSY